MRDWVLITGASSGIGRAVSIELSRTYDVVLNGRDEGRLRETASACVPEARKELLPLDVSQVETVADALGAFLESRKLNVTGLVHCAGVSRILPLRMTALIDVQDTFNTNVIAPLMIVKALASKRINGNALKNVVLISSNISDRGAKAFAAYGASKAGVNGLMRCLAVELAPNVRVNSVLPGAVRTRMTEKIFSNEEVVERMKSQYPLGLGTPQNIADAVAFLLSDKAAWITGQQITVDGGSTINITG